MSANSLRAGRVVTQVAAKLPHWIEELRPALTDRTSIMLRMMLLGLLIPLGIGVLAAMELRTPPPAAVEGAQPRVETTVGTSVSPAALPKADRLEVAYAKSETPAQPASVDELTVAPEVIAAPEVVALPKAMPAVSQEPPKQETPKIVSRHRPNLKPKKVTIAALPKSKPKIADIMKTIDIKRATIPERAKAAGYTESCRLSAFGGLRKALNTDSCEI